MAKKPTPIPRSVHLGERARVASAALGVVGEPARAAILWMLAAGEMRGEAIVAALGMKDQSVYLHFRVLRKAGLIDRRREDRAAFYHLTDRGREFIEVARRLGG